MIMRLTENNIRRVTVHFHKGVSYLFHVTMKSGRISDSREFINYDEKGRTTISEYTVDRLPKSVQKFIFKHVIKIKESYEDFTICIYE